MSLKIAPLIRYATLAEFVASQPDAQAQYENSAVLLIDDAQVSYDSDFFSKITLPSKFKKIGTVDGVTLSPYIMEEAGLVRNPGNPLTKVVRDDVLLAKLVYEFYSLDIQMRKMAAAMFPGFRRASYNCTFRLVPTRAEGLHFDYFLNGAPLDARKADQTRIKIFLNVDDAPRVWRVGPTLKEYLMNSKDSLPDALPADLNTLTFLLDRIGYVEKCDAVTVEIPPGGAVIANGATVAHEIVYGNRMIAIEILGVNPKHMPGFKGERIEVLGWLKDAGFQASTNFSGILEGIKGLPSGIDRSQSRGEQT